MIKNIYSITLSLSGMCQSAHLVQKLAYSGICDQNAFNTCLNSIIHINPTSIIEIYGNNEKNLIVGLEILISMLNFSHISYSRIEFITYILKMMRIARKLKNNSIARCSLKKNISSITKIYNIDNNTEILINQIAKLYYDIISPLGSQVIIKGLKSFLQNTQTQEKVRCLLFAGIRAIVLWKQFHGTPIQLIYFRNSIVQQAKKILCQL